MRERERDRQIETETDRDRQRQGERERQREWYDSMLKWKGKNTKKLLPSCICFNYLNSPKINLSLSLESGGHLDIMKIKRVFGITHFFLSGLASTQLN